MTQPGEIAVERPSQAVRAEAAAWIARLHGPERTAADEESFKRWVAASATHATAFERMTELWETGTRLKSDALARLKLQAQGTNRLAFRPSRLAWGIAGIAAAVIAVAVWRHNDQAVITRVGEQRTLTLEDGTRVTLNTATRVRLQYDRKQRRIELASGEALFEVSRRSDRPFVVAAGGREITALGTAFVVRRDAQELSVTLVEGKVGVTRPPTDAVVRQPMTLLTPGQRLTVRANQTPRIDRPALAKVTAWRQGVIAMDEMPLRFAVSEMNRYSEVPLIIDDRDADGVAVSGVFRAGDSLEFARALARSHGLQAQEESGRIVLSSRDAP